MRMQQRQKTQRQNTTFGVTFKSKVPPVNVRTRWTTKSGDSRVENETSMFQYIRYRRSDKWYQKSNYSGNQRFLIVCLYPQLLCYYSVTQCLGVVIQKKKKKKIRQYFRLLTITANGTITQKHLNKTSPLDFDHLRYKMIV